MKGELARSAKMADDTTYDRIWKYYFVKDSAIGLSDNEECIRKRWDSAWAFRCDILSKSETILALCETYGISERTARYDIKASERLFGNPDEGNKEAQRAIITEWLTRAASAANAAKDYMAVEKISGRIAKLNGLEDKDDNILSEMVKKMKPHTIIFSADPEVLKKQADELMKGIENTIDTDFEEEGDEEP